MGGVDTPEHLRNGRFVARRSSKPYMPLFHWVIDASLTNAWLVFRKLNYQKCMKKNARRDFHIKVVEELTGISNSASSSRVENDCSHSIERVSAKIRRVCRICASQGKQSLSSFRCKTSDVWLHIQVECWDKWHSASKTK